MLCILQETVGEMCIIINIGASTRTVPYSFNMQTFFLIAIGHGFYTLLGDDHGHDGTLIH